MPKKYAPDATWKRTIVPDGKLRVEGNSDDTSGVPMIAVHSHISQQQVLRNRLYALIKLTKN